VSHLILFSAIIDTDDRAAADDVATDIRAAGLNADARVTSIDIDEVSGVSEL
jgi:hypothetical protein